LHILRLNYVFLNLEGNLTNLDFLNLEGLKIFIKPRMTFKVKKHLLNLGGNLTNLDFLNLEG
jgi:hypothetical protein